MSEFPMNRRDLLRATGAGVVGGVGLSRVSTAEASSGGDKIWEFDTGASVLSSPTVVDGIVFIGSYDGSPGSSDSAMYALDTADGSEIWSFQLGFGIEVSPNVVDDTVFVGTNGAMMYALDTTDGNEMWSTITRGGIESSPTVVDGRVFFGSNDKNVYALDTEDGSERWSFRTESSVKSSPTVIDGTVFIGSIDSNVYALNANDGSEVWSFEMGRYGSITSSPTVVDGTVFIGSNDDNIYALDAADGSEVWSFGTSANVASSPTVIDGTVFIGGSDDNIYALDAADGSEVWSFGTGASVASSPTVVDDTVFVGSLDRMYALNATDGSEVWSFETDEGGWMSPTVVDGTVFIGSGNSLYALDAGVEGSSRGSRVKLGTLGHHHVFAEQGPTGPGVPEDPGLTAAFTFEPENPNTGDTVTFDAIDSSPADDIQEYRWDFTGDGDTDNTGITVDKIFEKPDEQTVRLTIVDGDGNEASTEKPIKPESPDDPKPKIDATSIDIDPYPVEQGDKPEIRIIVEAADEVEAILEKTDRSGAPATVTLDMEEEAENQWAATDHSVSFDEIGWWDLRIEAQSGTGESLALDTFEIDDPRDPDEQEGEWLIEDQELGFHVFEEVADVAVVVGWFADEDPPTDSQVAELSAWFEARERDTNYYFGSNRGMRGLVGFNMELRLFESGEVFEVESREYYEEEEFLSLPIVGDDAAKVFIQDLKSTAFPSDGLESYDFWIGTHSGEEVGKREGKHVTDAKGLYVPIMSRTPENKQSSPVWAKYIESYNVWNHEIGHAFDFGHPNDIGNQGAGPKGSHMCVMVQENNRLIPKERSPANEINPVPPVSTLHYLTEELAFSLDVTSELNPLGDEGLLTTSNRLNYEREDWLQPSKTEIKEVGQEYTDSKFVKGINSYNIGDQVPIVTATTKTSEQTVKYVLESRALIESNDGGDVDWSNDTGGLVIYKWEEPEGIDEDLNPSYNVLENGAGQRAIRNPGEEIRDELDDGRVVVFQLHNKEWKDGIGNPAGFHTEVKIKKEPGDSNTQTVTLDDPTSIPAGLDPSCFAEYTSPSLNLKAIDSEGRIVGINNDGEYVNQIPSAKGSGKRIQGTEWISVPEDTDVDFRVSSADVQRFIEDMEQLGTLADESDESDDSVSKSELEDGLTREYDVSQTTYGDNPELVEDDGETVVTDTTARVQREEIAPGDEHEATPRNPFSDVDIVAIYPDAESLVRERVVLTNHGDETIDLTGWQLINDSDEVFVMPEFELDPGQEVAVRTGAGEDTDTDLYRDAEQPQWNPDGGRVRIIDNTGTTVLSVTYDDRGVIEYDDAREDDDESKLPDYAGSDDLIQLVGLRDAIDDWRNNVIDDDLLKAVVDTWRTQREVD